MIIEMVNRVFIIFALSLYNMYSLNTHNFYSFRDMNLKFSDRTCLRYCNNMTLTLYMSKRFENTIRGFRIGTFLGLNVHLPCLVVYICDNRIEML